MPSPLSVKSISQMKLSISMVKTKVLPLRVFTFFKLNDLIYYLVWSTNMFVYIQYIHVHAYISTQFFFFFVSLLLSYTKMKLSETLVELTSSTQNVYIICCSCCQQEQKGDNFRISKLIWKSTLKNIEEHL